MDGEDKELVNEGMYGKALSIYLQSKLIDKGYKVPFYCNEDWGWWVEIKGFPHLMGLCIYGRVDNDESKFISNYVIASGVADERKWSWSKFKFVETTRSVNKLMSDTFDIFKSDIDIQNTKILDDMPW